MNSLYGMMCKRLSFCVKAVMFRCLQVLAFFFRLRVGCGKPSSFVLIPCDPGSVIGSRGDEAMIYAILEDFISRNPDSRAFVMVSSVDFARSDFGLRMSADFPGLSFIPCWRGHLHLFRMFFSIIRVRATEVCVIGADCMDGYYAASVSIALVVMADLACRLHISTRVTGFSFNEQPDSCVVAMMRMTSRLLSFRLRDPVSLLRFQNCVRPGTLVADVAFNLLPDFSARVTALVGQMNDYRTAGCFVLGLNLNPMLKVDIGRVNAALGNVVHSFAKQGRKIVIFCIPHDYRGSGDLGVLKKVQAPFVHLVAEVFSSAELKALTSGLDALWTSRMHLGIAALGMGKPVGAFSYQGKFLGLMQHFGLDDRFLLSPNDLSRFEEVLTCFVDDSATLSKDVAKSLPRVRALARLNLLESS